MAQDKDMQNQACRDYLANTSPAAWSYEGWLDYWRLHSPVVGYPDEIMYIDEARFQELRRAAARAQGVEEPGAQEPRAAAASIMEAQLDNEQAAFREKVLQSEWYAECIKQGEILPGLIWEGTLEELVRGLSDCVGLPSRSARNGRILSIWRVAANIFQKRNKNGALKPISEVVLENAARRASL